MIRIFGAFLLTLWIPTFFSSTHPAATEVQTKDRWVDSVMRSMSLRQKIGQLMMVAAYSNKDEQHVQVLETLVRDYHIGGVIFFQGGPVRQALITNRLQAIAKVPLWIAIDGEWGLGMRLDSTLSYPRQMTLGALRDDAYLYEMGKQIAEQCRRIGVHINFAPVVDINNNPANPVIGYRSFGENKYRVAAKGLAYARGMQEYGLIACAKHFPGHGDTDTDSHYALPVIQHSRLRLDTLELYPFKELILGGVKSMMVAHLYIPALDKSKRPTTLSRPVVTDLLRERLAYDGLLFTDALNMKGVSAYFKAGEIELMALEAGNDVLLFPQDVPQAVAYIEEAVKKGKLKEADLDVHVRRILSAKYDLGLRTPQRIETAGIEEDLHKPVYRALIEEAYQKALTLLRNEDDLLPFRHIELEEMASVSIGLPDGNEFQDYLDLYASFTHYAIGKEDKRNAYLYNQILANAERHSLFVVGIFDMNWRSKSTFGISPETLRFLKELQKKSKVVVAVFGSPYALAQLEDMEHLICAYEETPQTLRAVPQAIFGALAFEGRLPVSVGKFREGSGIITPKLQRLQYSEVPETAGLDSRVLRQVDALMQEAIKQQAMPGGQLLVARNGRVVWHKAYGHFTYFGERPVTLRDLYDIASVSKVAGTLYAIQFLYEQGFIDLRTPIKHYLPELAGNPKGEVTIYDLLLHQAGLKAFIPFWQRTLDASGQWLPHFYTNSFSESYPIEVAARMYAHRSLPDSLKQWVIESEMLKKRQGKYPFVYSDLGFYLLKEIAEKQLNQPLDRFLSQNLYEPLGAYRLMYRPTLRYPKTLIAPTEDDLEFRKQMLQGHVHDPFAAMEGGVGGHAGLFANANDLAKVMQMYLQMGYYGGRRYLMPQTVTLFSARQERNNRRGLGWDKPPKGQLYSYISRYASPLSYGHSGFTGTVVWADPTYNLLIVFLSNRVHPTADNQKLVTGHVRRRVSDVVYSSLMEHAFLFATQQLEKQLEQDVQPRR